MLILLLACAGGAGDATVPADDAALVAQLPSALACGQATWAQVTATNTGTATWNAAEGYGLAAQGDDPFASGTVWLDPEVFVAPGEALVFDLPLVAPQAPGEQLGTWTMTRAGTEAFGAELEATITVSCGGDGGAGDGGAGDGGSGDGGAGDGGASGGERGGRVGLSGYSLVDDHGPFNALGATMMWGAWGYRHDRARLEENLAWLAAHGFHYVRVLGVVGDPDAADYWDGREVSTRWHDYDAVIAGFTDLAWDVYGLRTEWTLIGDGQITVPSEAERYALVDRFLAMSLGREEKIIHFEIANEAWQNGFSGDEGNTQLRALSAYMRDRTDILVAASAPAGQECADQQYLYQGDIADLATIHFDRDTSYVEGAWRPVRQPWELVYCEGLPVGSNNEPIGPGSSVAEDDEPIRLVSAALVTYVANLPLYVFHSRAGVRGDDNLYDMRGADSFSTMASYLPGDVASWDRQNAHWKGSPFKVYAVDGAGTEYGDSMWVDLHDPQAGAVRVYSETTDTQFFSVAIGVLGWLPLEARRPLAAEALDPLTGAVLESVELSAGQRWTLSGAEAYVIRGSWR